MSSAIPSELLKFPTDAPLLHLYWATSGPSTTHFSRSWTGGPEKMTGQASFPSLHEGGLVLKYGEGLLEAVDLGCATSLSFLVSLGLGNAAFLHLAIVLIDCTELRISGLAVGGKVGNRLILSYELLCLVLGVLLLEGRRHFVLLR